ADVVAHGEPAVVEFPRLGAASLEPQVVGQPESAREEAKVFDPLVVRHVVILKPAASVRAGLLRERWQGAGDPRPARPGADPAGLHTTGGGRRGTWRWRHSAPRAPRGPGGDNTGYAATSGPICCASSRPQLICYPKAYSPSLAQHHSTAHPTP